MKYYAGPILWMAVMFAFSTDAGSMVHTNSLLSPIIRFFSPNISKNELVSILIITRKIAHVIEYAVLAVLWLYALKRGKDQWWWSTLFGAFAISVAYAAIDEFHQAFIPSRTPSLTDVWLDSFGAILGLGIWSLSQTKRLPALGMKFFGWWFAWGIFSAIMVLIVLKGGTLSFGKMLLVIVSVGVLSGSAGVLYYGRHR